MRAQTWTSEAGRETGRAEWHPPLTIDFLFNRLWEQHPHYGPFPSARTRELRYGSSFSYS